MKKSDIKGPWTQFWDMHSGGGQKLQWAKVYIQAPKEEAELVFQNRFKRNPNRVTCTCCGPDYSISEEPDLREITAYQRGCAYVYRDAKGREVPRSEAWIPGKGTVKGVKASYEEHGGGEMNRHTYRTLEDYVSDKSVKVIFAKDIKPAERKGDLRSEGYVWQE